MAFSLRTGVSAVLHEMGDATGLSVVLDEPSVPLSEPVRGTCELLGLDPLYVANEGKLLLIAVPKDSERALACLRQHAFRATAAISWGGIVHDSPHTCLCAAPWEHTTRA